MGARRTQLFYDFEAIKNRYKTFSYKNNKIQSKITMLVQWQALADPVCSALLGRPMAGTVLIRKVQPKTSKSTVFIF